MSDSLTVVAEGLVMGEVLLRGDRLSFRYKPDWQASENAFPLSLSMPLIVKEHGHRVVEAFLWGLLPDNDAVLSRWGRRFRVSPRNPFRLIEHVGEDCAGAVQFVRADRLENLLAEGTEPKVSWMSSNELNERVAAVVADACPDAVGNRHRAVQSGRRPAQVCAIFRFEKETLGSAGRTHPDHAYSQAGDWRL